MAEGKRITHSVKRDPVQEAADIAQEKEKKDVNLEVLEDVEETAQQPVYQIRPPLHEKFKPLSAKEIIHDVLFDQLATKSYDAEAAAQWTKDIADVIERRIKESSGDTKKSGQPSAISGPNMAMLVYYV